MRGEIEFYSDQKGYGFIKPQGGPHGSSTREGNVFFHVSALTRKDDMCIPRKGDVVEFDMAMDAGKGPRAQNVILIAEEG